jgi:F0F1-type ATP synthase delta subunit
VAKVTSAGRYAQAVFEIALEKNELDGWQTDLSRIAAMGEDKEFAGLIENPRVPLSRSCCPPGSGMPVLWY